MAGLIPMKTLTIGNDTFEIVDETARTATKSVVKKVNGVTPDADGSVTITTGSIQSVNGVKPDSKGNVNIPTGTVTDMQVEAAIGKWLDENPSSTSMPSNKEQVSMLIEADLFPAVHNADGAILTDQNGKIILRY